jgi:glycosyltransferase involved in cell wall biosynthesis
MGDQSNHRRKIKQPVANSLGQTLQEDVQLKICFVNPEIDGLNKSGITTYVDNMAYALADQGNQVEVVQLSSNSSMEYFDGDVHVVRLKFKDAKILGKFLAEEAALTRKLWYNNFDIIEAAEFGAGAFFSIYLQNTPIVTRLHTPLYLTNKLADRETGFKTSIINFMEKNQTVHSSGITSPTVALKQEIACHWKIDTSRITVIPNSIRLDKINPPNNTEVAVNGDYLVFVGRLEERKGVLILAKALPGVFEKYPKLKVVFVGKDMPYQQTTLKQTILNLNQKYVDNLIFTGFVSEETKMSLVKNATLVVLPSLWENFPYTCLEAMALGKAIVASGKSGFEEIIEDNYSGFLVEPGNVSVLEEKIIACLSGKVDLGKVGEAAGTRVMDFDSKKIAMDTLKYYEKVLDER